MVTTKLKLPMFYLNARDIQKESFKGIEASVRRCFSKYVFLKI